MINRIFFLGLSFFLSNFMFSQINDIVNLYNTGAYQQVINQTNNLLEQNDCDFNCLYYRGLSQQALFSYKDAVNTFELAVNQQPDSIYLQIALAKAWEQAGNDDEAVVIYQQILQKDTDQVSTLVRLATIYKGDREYLKAIDLYSKLVQKDSTNGFFYSQLAWCCSKMALAMPALDYYIRAWHLNSSDLNSAKGIVNELVNIKDYESTLGYLDTFAIVFPQNIYFKKQKAFVLALTAKYLESIQEFKEIVALGDTSMFTCKYYGQSLYSNANYEEAIFWLERYIENNNDDTQNTYILGLACQKDYQYEKSLHYFEMVLNKVYNKSLIALTFTEMANTQIAYGDYLGFRDSTGTQKPERYKQAVDYFLLAVELTPQDNELNYKLAQFYDSKKHDKNMALYYLDKYYKNAKPGELNEWELEYVQKRMRQLKEELHFEVD